jgi:hypothetical protein
VRGVEVTTALLSMLPTACAPDIMDIDDIDFDLMLVEIDAFSRTFQR